MMVADLTTWDRQDLIDAKAFLDNAGNHTDLGDLSDCPEWVRFCASRYIDSLTTTEEQDTVQPAPIFQARTDYERKMKAKIAAHRADLWDRQDWLKGRSNEEQFGQVAGVPDWVREAAIRDLQQQIFNLSAGQRRNPAVRNPL